MKKNDTDKTIVENKTSSEATIISEKSKEIEKKPKKTKKVAKKDEAKIPRKKLPKLLKKKYNKKNLGKKLLSKIFIADDKKYVESLFVETKIGKKEKVFFLVPEDKKFTKAEIKRLKIIVNDVKKQKGAIKLLPLIIVVLLVASVFLFTDLILKIGLKSTLQNTFKAKTDIGYVHLDYLESSLAIKNLEVANKDAPMTNLFQFDEIVMDIDINRLLQKSVVIDEISAVGFATGTERKTSGELIIKEKVKKEKQPKEEKEVKEKTSNGALIKPELIENAKSRITTELQGIFAKFDPDTIIKSAYDSLQTPVVSNSISTELTTLIPYWQSKPGEIKAEVSSFIKDVDKISSMDFTNIKDLNKLQENIDTMSTIIKNGENLSNKLQSTYKKLETDYNNVSKYTTNLQKAIQADTKLASNLTSNIKNFTPQNGMKLLSSTLEDFLNNTLGGFYPTIKEGLALVKEIKSKIPVSEKEEKVPEKKIERLKGTNFTWGKEEKPQFYVCLAHISGSGFDIQANHLSNNPKLVDYPMTLDGTYTISNRQDSFNAALDLRENTKNPMFFASYNIPTLETKTDFLTSNSVLDIQMTVNDNENISIYGNAVLDDAKFILPTFTPEFAYNICDEAVSKIDETYLGVNAEFSNQGNLKVGVNTDFDNKFMKEITALANAELASIKDKATKEISAKLEEYSAPVKAKIEEFNKYKAEIEKTKKELEQKIAEVKAKSEEAKSKLVEYGKNQAESLINDTVNKYVDTDKIKSWF